MAESLIFVPESDEEKAKKILKARAVLALTIADEAFQEYLKQDELQGKPEAELAAAMFASIFQQLC